uniref:Uncharacterized protein n=1 Tax=Octactis speculum TaxID=3111310 RepID=A0A7S2MC55_9STRA|mmetsp:Transcript_59390/g.81122  ORF Transcript_59390/g.81122 Transcript_59390/m.81122 type:complete len:438 (+) Transcript_59390:2-1315(+)
MTKFMLLDPLGFGLEMEGGKPGWNDAMNGLCALFGSGMPEMYELLRLLNFCHSLFDKYSARSVDIPTEVDWLIADAVSCLNAYDEDGDDFKFWNDLSAARDRYRDATKLYVLQHTVKWSLKNLKDVFANMIKKVETGTIKALEFNGGKLAPSYFIFDVTDYSLLGTYDQDGRENVKVLGFSPRSVPFFLEGPTRQLKTLKSIEERRRVYDEVKKSDLYDTALQMYKISGSLESMDLEIGRMVAFAPGWLENESIWLHMSYKYYLELLRGGLFAEYYDSIKTGVVAFMDPVTYGRSPLECSSFIVSSAYPDKTAHGQGYLARLSGSTAEFLSMWNTMMAGPKPFKFDESVLTLELKPALVSWLFDETGDLQFTFIGSVEVTYHNPSKLDTWSSQVSKTLLTDKGGDILEISGGVIPAPYASDVRSLKYVSIEMFFGEL